MNKNSLNKVILIGRIGQDPEQRQTSNGMAIVNFSLATTDSRKVGEQYQDTTEWHKCVAFGKTAEFITNYSGKGRLVSVEGKLKTSNWEKDGVKHYKTEILVDTFISLDRAVVGNDNTNGSATYQQSTNAQPKPSPTSYDNDTGNGEDNNSDLPF